MSIMKSFLLLLSLCLAITAFGQKQFYGTISANYSKIDYVDYYSGTNFRQTIENPSLSSSVTLGIGYQLPINQRMSGKFLLDFSSFSGKFDYKSNNRWFTKTEGELICNGIEFRLIPQFNFKFTEKINASVGVLLGLRVINSFIRGQSIAYGALLENNQIVTYPSPIVSDAHEGGVYEFPRSSTGMTMAINYQLKPSLELFGRYVFERNIAMNSYDAINIHQLAIGVNYYL